MSNILNQNIKNFRIFRGLTQEDLASKLHKTKNVISNWERGENNPDVESIEIICNMLDVTPNQLFGWELCEAYERYKKSMDEKKAKLMELEEEKKEIQKKIENLKYELREDDIKRSEGSD